MTPWPLYIVNPLLSPPGLIYFKHIGGEGLFEEGLFNLAKKMVPVLHKDLEYKVEKFKYKKLEVMQPRIKSKPKLPAGE